MRQASIRQHQEAERLEARISADKKNILRNAAELSGRTLTDFVVHSAYEAAIRVIQEYQQLHLTTIDRNVFIQALFTSPKTSNSLLNAAKRYKKNVDSK
ncbi:MAG: DUF1778 domain-containing protein [Gammaproteobacteria bacterium]|nr:DUF1778 domain-containing protein [Gammaproteobacteria bacterium]